MLYFVTDVGGCKIVVQTLIIICNDLFLLRLLFALSFSKELLQVCWIEEFNKWKVFFLLILKESYLIVTRRFSWINKNWRAYHWTDDILRKLTLFLIAKDNNEEMKFRSFIIIRGWTKPKAIKWTTSLLKFDMILSLDSNVL